MPSRNIKKKNDIVLIENHFRDLPLRGFTAAEIDILMALCFKCQNEETNEVKFTFNELAELADYHTKDKKKFINKILQTNKKLISLNITLTSEDQKIIKQFVLFSDFEIDSEGKELRVRVHEPFAFLLNRLTDNFTKLELETSSSLKTVYAKQIYKKLRQFKNQKVPFWQVDLTTFREYLDIPDSYKVSVIDQKVINPAIEELTPLFQDLKCQKVYESIKSGSGRPNLVGYKFSYKNLKEDALKKEHNPNMERLAEKTGWKKIGKYCPKCLREVYLKEMSNDWGEYPLIGHPDFRTGGCHWTTTSYGDALTDYDAEKKREKIESPETKKEIAENKEKIRELTKGLFDYKF